MPPSASSPSPSPHPPFKFTDDDERETRPMSAGADSARTKRASSSYGVALTSTPSQDQQQKTSVNANAWKRKSAPGSEYADFVAGNSSTKDFGELLRLTQPGERGSGMSASHGDSAKRRSQYYEEGAMDGVKERQSPVIAELKTNVIIKDEFNLVTELSYHLAGRYNRPEECVLIRIDHSACLALGGNFDPCYHLTITTVPSQMSSSTNRRNAAMIQSFMEGAMKVPSERGIVTFVPIPEDYLAMNGQTMSGEAERLEKRSSVNDQNGLKSANKDATRRSMTFPAKSNSSLNGENKSNGSLTANMTNGKKSPSPTPPAQLQHKSSSSEKDGRPSTAHGGFDGLRMNGISTEILTGNNARLPNGRPKTFDGGSSSKPTSVQEPLKSTPRPHLASQQSQQSQKTPQRSSMTKRPTPINGPPPTTKTSTSARPPSALRTNSSSITPATARPTITNTTPSALPTETRAKNTYLDNISSLGKKGTPIPSNPIIRTTSPSADADDDEDAPAAKSAGASGKANTAKRRSTITATPSLPSNSKEKGEKGERGEKGKMRPPPVPVSSKEEEETRSLGSRLGKRKSFMKMFSRRSVPAWYEQ
ncbi:uncharacterized protein LTR77_008213 [Saxophila tyrrhenica]|uniref:L-dopachrome isomerase n=1 Tax=Saxophila tyrrhenica TaxID=1690608 RepID=A0AAV9P2U1_9PEZI|nr:hypothetical protein LTR77_008213 [Saxophila tyrrhenica]